MKSSHKSVTLMAAIAAMANTSFLPAIAQKLTQSAVRRTSNLRLPFNSYAAEHREWNNKIDAKNAAKKAAKQAGKKQQP